MTEGKSLLKIAKDEQRNSFLRRLRVKLFSEQIWGGSFLAWRYHPAAQVGKLFLNFAFPLLVSPREQLAKEK